ncbi:ABC transporter ATP-binding protein [Sulfitobacter alexandrii]|uniref:ABC transporter ATP-binding protein n=1 Tax=Sulfitobacter alexandrii TaxID=1917485 RepID=A0A1J0WEU7_9RHOB|nr:ATP-binding cassette domain-containing protein [Sulfitobacter alexandrii]APE42827.1 ABC transporter ATP-binding protein [Sulfitobacter alexandrii]
MTRKRALTLTISNGGASRRAVAPPARADNANRFEDRISARAELAATYAGLLGVDAVARDLFESIGARTGTGRGRAEEAQAICHGLKELGLLAQVSEVTSPMPALWPALAYMTSGQVVLVLGQSRDELTIYDRTCTDHRAQVPLAEFAPFFGGIVVRAEASLRKVAETHRTETRQPHWFWGQFDRFRRQLAEVALGSLVANLLAVAVALFSLQVYDRVIPHQSEATLWVLAAGAGLALLMEAFIKIARARLMDGAGRQIELGVQRILMGRILGMRSDIPGQAPHQVFSAMREFGSVREFFTASTVGTLADLPFILVFLLLVASIAGNVVWVLILGGILMVVPGFVLQKRMMRLTQETQGASAKSSRLLHETLFELDTLKTQRGEDRVMRLWSELNALSAMKSSEQRRLASVLTFWSQGVQQATYVAAVITGTYLVFAGEFTVGSIIAVGILTGRTLAPLTQLAGTMARWGNVKSALDGLEAVAQAPQDADSRRTYLRRETLRGDFEFRDVTFRYEEDGAPIVDIRALAIRPGQKVAVLGANGSGKSSLLKLMSGLYAPATGRVMIDGTDLSQIEPRDLRRLIGYLGQDVRLFAGTLRDNLNLTMLERDDARLMQALEFAGLGPFVQAHPKGLDLEIRDSGAGLSIGQRQSVGWARLWLQDPRVCLLDEPTAALDQTLEATLVARLGDWMAQRTAIIATHRAPILALTDRAMLLQAGRMTVDGPRDKVLGHLAGLNGGRAA